MKTLVIVSCLAACALATFARESVDRTLDEQWKQFKSEHNKKYSMLGEEFGRRLIWQENVKKINQHNLEADLGKHSYRMGLNKYSDMKPEEFKAKFRNLEVYTAKPAQFVAPKPNIPEAVDWRSEGYVTPVKDQGQIGSSSFFSSVGSIEGQNFKKTGKLIPLSVQQLDDCLTDKNELPHIVFDEIVKMGGLLSEKDYVHHTFDHYTFYDRCEFNSSKIAVVLGGHRDVDTTEEALQIATATVGPIAVAIDASSLVFYKSGIFNDNNCNGNSPNHAILIVGYGSENGKDYWIAKNSWGVSWGEKGYIRIQRNANNVCGIASFASYPIIW